MRTKIIILTITILIMLATSFVLFLSKSQKTKSPISQNTQISPTSAIPPISKTIFKDYIDASGFKFSYPENLQVTPDKITDPSIYSQVAIKSNKQLGSIKLKVEDTQLISLNDYLKANKISSTSSAIKDARLGELDAKEIQTQTGITLVALDTNTLFTIETDLKDNKDYWKETYQRLISSFVFIIPTNAPAYNSSGSDSSSSSEDVIDQGEEIVE